MNFGLDNGDHYTKHGGVIMNWKDLIPSCFGTKDKIFADHPSDRSSAAKLLAQANEENIGWKEYTETIESWLKKEKCTPEHIQEQMKSVGNIKSYFKD